MEIWPFILRYLIMWKFWLNYGAKCKINRSNSSFVVPEYSLQISLEVGVEFFGPKCWIDGQMGGQTSPFNSHGRLYGKLATDGTNIT